MGRRGKTTAFTRVEVVVSLAIIGVLSAIASLDRFLVTVNSLFDLYSKDRDGLTQAALTPGAGSDVIVATDRGYIGLARAY